MAATAPATKPEGAPSRADQAGALLLGRVLAVLSESIVMLVVVRLLGKAEVGVLSALLLIYQTLAIVMTAGVPGAMMYFLPSRPPGERAAIARLTFLSLGALGVVMGVVLAGLGAADLLGLPVTSLADGGERGSLRYLLALAPWPLFDLPVRALPNLLVAELRARDAAFAGIVKTIGGSLSTVLPIALGGSLFTVGASMTLFGAVYALAVPFYLRRLYAGAAAVPSPVGPRELLGFAVPLGMTDIVSALGQRIDRYILLSMLTAEAFAEYQVGAWQIPFIVNIPYAVGTAWAPHLRVLFAEKRHEEAIAVWRASIHRVALIVVPVTTAFIVAAEETMSLLFTDAYVRAATIFRCYSLLTLGRVAAFGGVIVAAGRPRYVLTAAALSLVCTVACEVPLAWWLGFAGPAIGAVVAYVPTVALYCWFISRASGVPLSRIFPARDYLRVVALSAMAAAPGVGVKLVLGAHPAVVLAAVVAVVLAAFAGLATLTRDLGREEWAYVWRWLRLRPLARGR